MIKYKIIYNQLGGSDGSIEMQKIIAGITNDLKECKDKLIKENKRTLSYTNEIEEKDEKYSKLQIKLDTLNQINRKL